jgi:hypothetical protein
LGFKVQSSGFKVQPPTKKTAVLIEKKLLPIAIVESTAAQTGIGRHGGLPYLSRLMGRQSKNFSFAVLLTAKEKYYSLCDLCVSSEAGGEINPLNKYHSRIARLGPPV